MNDNITLGFDRAIPKVWADYALELFITGNEFKQSYQFLKDTLARSTSSTETPRKIANHLQRLWLSEDENSPLRKKAGEIYKNNPNVDTSILHFGMAINSFPLFLRVCRSLGELSQFTPRISSQQTISRVAEHYPTPTTVPPAVTRVIQTLCDWEFIRKENQTLIVIDRCLESEVVGGWYIQALMNGREVKTVPLYDLLQYPEILGVELTQVRTYISSSNALEMGKDSSGREVFRLK